MTADFLRKIYRELLELYFGNEIVLEENSDMEGLRIPHFYSAFYVYKYATGISAALALSKRVLNGGEQEREDYFKFLKSTAKKTEKLSKKSFEKTARAPLLNKQQGFKAAFYFFCRTGVPYRNDWNSGLFVFRTEIFLCV